MTDQMNLVLELDDIEAQIASLQAKRQEIKDKRFNEAINSIKEIMSKNGLTLLDIQNQFANVKTNAAERKSTTSNEPKYRGPNGEISGSRGRSPSWLAKAVAAGAKKEDFLIKPVKIKK